MAEKNRIDILVESIASPSVLRMCLMKTKKISGSNLVFVFEGTDDYMYYEHAISKCGFEKDFEHVVANGKQQIVNLYNELKDKNDVDFLRNIYFFIDQDYDNFTYVSDEIFNLELYAIENYLFDSQAIESILRDELMLHGEKSELRKEYLISLRKSFADFSKIMLNLSHYLFVCKFNSLPQKYFTLSPHFIEVKPNSAQLLKNPNMDYLKEAEEYCHHEMEFAESINNLSIHQLIRGKYILWFIQKWLLAVKEEINNGTSQTDKVRLSDGDITIRRLSQNCGINNRLYNFLKKIPATQN
jgi:hypothetical protein